MKSMTFRLPEKLVAEIEAESRKSGVSKSDVVRRRLEQTESSVPLTMYDVAKDLIGSVNDPTLPRDLSARKKYYLKKWGYGKKRHR
jgi:hypothetical protein